MAQKSVLILVDYHPRGLFHETTSLVKPVHGLVKINFLCVWMRLTEFYRAYWVSETWQTQ
ncbi:MAG: hypothetical protein GY820_25280 [Gammaproteobacteria bacterium]|nr:hypothetical protein [Gammaproteobacteria bacterium]